ncbi:hypothetical protein SRB5_62360 [Streptomyces sp. RB5]|uniref:MaoC-like domain-containing protein n=1 Tax=Streptomyces smaragdinus TaxID=2585196 RepID=A0A7K0CTI8_9ACTN|nr:MaoC/PaaZ C-terminal domain-containing protein [Streptomyces smaragdinus]MQY16044.1 hypothetical protein [Streptomyces smaragdinus]
MQTLPKPPGLAGSYVKAVLPRRRPPGATLPTEVLRLAPTLPSEDHVRRYAKVCGYSEAPAHLPPLYPHIAAFPLAMRLMTSPAFPYPVLGMVHLSNRIDHIRPITATEPLTYEVWTENLRPHPKGKAFDVRSRALSNDTPVWDETSTYLARGKGEGTTPPWPTRDFTTPSLTETWQVTQSTIRTYAATSGDRNPIHLHPLTARLFGFPRSIAHGMWTKARSLASLSSAALLPDAYTATTDFRAPVLLPATPEFRAASTSEGTAFALRRPNDEKEHLRGLITPLEP